MTDRGQSMLSAMLMAIGAFVIFSTGDALARSMAGQWPGTAIATLRYGVATLVLAPLLARREGRAGFTTTKPWIQIGRGLAIATSGTMFWISLSYMPLADATAILFTNPVWTAILSALFLGERIGRFQIVLMAVAFIGALIVLQPNVTAFGAVALLPLGGAIGMATLMILNGRSAGSTTVLGGQFWLNVVATVVLVPISYAGDAWGGERLAIPSPSAWVVAKCLMIAVTGSLGHLLLYRATLRVPAATVAPMAYVQIVCAVAFGWALFQAPPTLPMLIGGAVIIGSGWLLIRSNLRTARAVAETGGTPD